MPTMGFLQNRAYLLTVIGIITTVSAIGPFFFEEVACSVFSPAPPDEHDHNDVACWKLIGHGVVHITAITLGAFLAIISIIAYHTTRNTNMVWTMLAFVTFTLLSVFLLQEDLNADRLHHDETGNTVAVWVDILLTVMIGFFGIGVFSNQKFPTRRTYD